METITFYSYKGGVGRTLALANTAIYLSRFGLNICIMDFDLEAPGLHYKFPQYLKTSDVKAGLVDYIHEFKTKDAVPESILPFSIEIVPKNESQGVIRLIPAGNVLSAEYWKKLASIDWYSLFYRDESEGVPFFLEMKKRIEKELNPDFLLIDSRTGITEMSGVCTALLPDKVAFLIANNQENIEGASQIYKGISKLKRLPGQQPVKVIFALTRIPAMYVKSDDLDKENEKIENQIIGSVLDILNKGINDQENKFSDKDICILHSDRSLELSESLRFGESKSVVKTNLTIDYIRFFMKVLPQDIVSQNIDWILNNILSTDMILNDPDQVQQELEELASKNNHPKVLEKLIEFYILRKVGIEKILDAFDDLWRIFGISNPKILSKYIPIFMDWDFKSKRKPNLDIVIKYINLDPIDRIFVEENLVRAYKLFTDDPKKLLQYYHNLINKAKYKSDILGQITDILMSDSENILDVISLFDKYQNIVNKDANLKIKKITIFFALGGLKEINKLLDEGWISAEEFLYKEPNLFLSVMSSLGRENLIDDILDRDLEKALIDENYDELYQVGSAYYELGRQNEFKDKITEKNKEENSTVQKALKNLDSSNDIPF